MTNEVAKKQEKALSEIDGDITQAEDILNSDIVIPKILLMQGTSELVNERKAQQGDIVNSVTSEKIGDPEVPISIIPITFRNTWRHEEIVAGKPEYRFVESRDASNEHDEWNYTRDGAEWKRTKVLELFVLRPEDVDAQAKQADAGQKDDDFIPDLNSVVMPHVISFRSTSFTTGQQLVSMFAKARSVKTGKYPNGCPAYLYTVGMSCEVKKNDKNMWYTWKVGATTKSTPAQIAEAAKWHGILASQAKSFKVDDSQDVKREVKITEDVIDVAEETQF